MTQIFEVENIRCGGCVNSIRKSLMGIEGIDHVEVDKEAETITVEGVIEDNLVYDTLAHMGYPAKGKNSIGRKAKSLVSCAIGKLN